MCKKKILSRYFWGLARIAGSQNLMREKVNQKLPAEVVNERLLRQK